MLPARLPIAPLVTYSEEKKAIVGPTGETYRGICRLIEREFFPNYTFEWPSHPQPLIVSGTPSKKPLVLSGQPPPTSPPTAKKYGKAGLQVSGMELGTLVDSQLNFAVRYMVRTKTSIAAYLAANMRLPKHVDTCPCTEHRVHHRTRSALKRFKKLKLTPVAAQLPVACKRSRTATFMDTLWYNAKTKRFFVCEGKSGFHRYYQQASKTGQVMTGVFSKITDSPQHQHQLQLFVTCLLFCHNYGLALEQIDAAVMRVTEAKVFIYHLAKWVLKQKATVAALCL